MNEEDQHDPETQEEDSAPDWLLEGLRNLPSELAQPTPQTDDAIMRMARERLTISRRRSAFIKLKPALAVAACIALGIFGFTQLKPPSTNTVPPVVQEDDAAIILREVATLFPGHVRSIVRDGTELQVELMDEPSAGPRQAVVLEICERDDCQEIITFIGQTVEIQGHSVIIQSDSSGQITLEGTGISWSSGHPTQPLPNLNIRTRVI